MKKILIIVTTAYMDEAERCGCVHLLDEGQVIAEVFHSDADGSMGLTTYRWSLPLEAVEWLIAEARTRLG